MIDFLARFWDSLVVWLIGGALAVGYIFVVLAVLYLAALSVIYWPSKKKDGKR